jgi:ribonuclease HI
VDHSSLEGLLLGGSSFPAFLKELFLACIIHSLHTLWMARNGILFNNARISLQAAITKVRTTIALSASSINNTAYQSPSERGTIVGNASTVAVWTLNWLQVAQRPIRSARIFPVIWKTPVAPWLKVNTNGSVRDGLAACGAIFRDYAGGFCCGFSCRLNVSSVLHLELLAIIISIEQAHQRGWSQVWVESDSQVSIQATKDKSIVPWDIRNRWLNCFSLNMQMLFSHTFREGNSCADKLASHDLSTTGFHWWY